jgi:hypothetical protein
MAGSKRWYVYTTNNGTDFAINLDESNTAETSATPTFWGSTDSIFTLPRNIRPRGYYYESSTSTRRIFLTFLTQTDFDAAPASIDDPLTAGATLVRGTPREERRRPVPRPFDTGLTSP